MALRACCNIEGDLVVVDNWSSANDETSHLSQNSVSSLYRKPVIRARSGLRRSDYSESSQGSCASVRSNNSHLSRQGIIVRHKKRADRNNKRSTTHPKENIELKTQVQTNRNTILNKAIGGDLQMLQKLLKQNHLKLSIKDNAVLIAKCEKNEEKSSHEQLRN